MVSSFFEKLGRTQIQKAGLAKINCKVYDNKNTSLCHYGKCIHLEADYYKCICDTGYKGIYCDEIIIDPKTIFKTSFGQKFIMPLVICIVVSVVFYIFHICRYFIGVNTNWTFDAIIEGYRRVEKRFCNSFLMIFKPFTNTKNRGNQTKNNGKCESKKSRNTARSVNIGKASSAESIPIVRVISDIETTNNTKSNTLDISMSNKDSTKSDLYRDSSSSPGTVFITNIDTNKSHEPLKPILRNSMINNYTKPKRYSKTRPSNKKSINYTEINQKRSSYNDDAILSSIDKSDEIVYKEQAKNYYSGYATTQPPRSTCVQPNRESRMINMRAKDDDDMDGYRMHNMSLFQGRHTVGGLKKDDEDTQTG